jgi:hypothetical protein
MSDMPTLVKVLRYLHDNSEPSSYNDIISAVQERQALVDKALEKLVAERIVHSRDSLYSYNATPRAEELCQKLFALYEKILARPQLELLARGLICQADEYYPLRMNTLLRVLEKEGFAAEDVTRFLDGEVKMGYVKRMPAIFGGRVWGSPPLFIRYYLGLAQFGQHDYPQPEDWSGNSGLAHSQEDYLLSNYPPELAEPAVQYIETVKPELGQVIMGEALQRWYGSSDPDTRLR